MMKKVFLFTLCWSLISGAAAQSVSQQLQKAFQQFEKDDQLKHAISSLYVIDAKTGQVVFDKNSQIGLAPASTQKIITSVTAFELLGKAYRYKTELGYEEDIYLYDKRAVKNFFLFASGDPTLGSWRYNEKADELFLKKLFSILNDSTKKSSYDNANSYSYLTLINTHFENNKINDRWIWQDIGNYYGATHNGMTWRENQFDICFNTGDKEGEKVQFAGTKPEYIQSDLAGIEINIDSLKAGKVGSGDNAYVYYSNENVATVRGSVPPGKKSFTISATHPRPEDYFYLDFLQFQNNSGEKVGVNFLSDFDSKHFSRSLPPAIPKKPRIIYTHYSPSLDSIIYWFNKKSINLYGEALIKTFAYEKQGFGSTDSGVAIVKKFWKGKGLDEDELNIYDGSGLSPLNRVTTHAQVEILKYAKTKDWFPYFLKSLPDYNGMTMKSGTISDVKGFCGYHTAKDGKEYIFSFLVNNYSGKTSGVVGKMYKVLDELK